MRCREVQNRVERIKPENLPDEILTHLDACQVCAEYARRSERAGQLLKSASVNDDQSVMPLAARRRLVETQVAGDSSWVERFAETVLSIVGWRPVRYVYASALAVILAVVTLVPFGYDQVIGYNLSLAGICREVAEDHETVCDLLMVMGVQEAVIDVTSCDSTCNLVVFDLRSRDEVRLTVAAFDDLGAQTEIASITRITNRTSGTLLRQADERLLSGWLYD